MSARRVPFGPEAEGQGHDQERQGIEQARQPTLPQWGDDPGRDWRRHTRFIASAQGDGRYRSSRSWTGGDDDKTGAHAKHP